MQIFHLFFCSFPFILYLCTDLVGLWAGRVKDIDGTLEADEAICRAGRGGKAFTDVTFCEFKLRNFDSSHRGNATESVCVRELYPDHSYIYWYVARGRLYNSAWRGLAALLILAKGQCEGLNSGMSEKLESPMPFLFPYSNNY